MDHQTVAAISLGGIWLDVLGGLYLAYDLLGGQHGPLRLLTRMVTYAIVFGVGYGLGLGLFFGVVSGLATGVTVAIEMQRTGSHQDHYSLPWEFLFGTIRGAAFGAGLYRMVGLKYAVLFASMISVAQVVAYSRGMRPGMDYASSRRPRFSRRQMWGAIIRTFGYMATALTCSFLVGNIEHPWLIAIRLGLVTGVVTAVGTAVNPFIEYFADHLPERRLGVFGIWLVLCGFVLQSVQYWLAMFDVRVI